MEIKKRKQVKAFRSEKDTNTGKHMGMQGNAREHTGNEKEDKRNIHKCRAGTGKHRENTGVVSATGKHTGVQGNTQEYRKQDYRGIEGSTGEHRKIQGKPGRLYE